MRKLNRRHALALGAGAAAHAVLVACGGDSSSDAGSTAPATTAGPPTTTGAGATTATTVATTTATTAASGDQPLEVPPIEDYDLDATMRFMYVAPPTRFDPHRATASFDNTSLQPVYDRLIHLQQDGLPGPGLATDWAFSDDGSSLELTIREGVLFHDGTPLDAAAVKANIERAQTVEGSAVASELAAITSIEVAAPDRVVLALSAPSAQLPAVLSDRAGMMVSPAAFDKPDLDVAPVGTGMFRVTSYEVGIQIVYERFEDYWDPDSVRCAKIEWLITPDPTTRLNALKTGEINGTIVAASDDALAEQDGLSMVRRGGLDLFHLQLNRSFEPFANADVRRAINHAIDRRSLVDTILFGLATVNSQNFPEGYFAFDEATGTDPFPYDQDLARELLASAGYADGFEFELLYQTFPGGDLIPAALQAQLGEIGITVNARGIEPVQAGDIFYAREEGNALAAQWGGRADPTQSLRLLFTAEGFSNPGGHTTPEMTAAIEATAIVQPEADRTAAVQAASAQIVADALDVVLYFPITSYAFDDQVIGPESWGLGRPEFRYVGMRKA